MDLIQKPSPFEAFFHHLYNFILYYNQEYYFLNLQASVKSLSSNISELKGIMQ